MNVCSIIDLLVWGWLGDFGTMYTICIGQSCTSTYCEHEVFRPAEVIRVDAIIVHST
jgi:hypothetical protein